MARNDESQRGQGTPSRVYKSSDVHKRRVERKPRGKRAEKAHEPDSGSVQAETPPPGNVSPKSPDAAYDAREEAVVIVPEFGRKTEAQREADDRWFAAMREEDLPARRLDIPEVGNPPEDDSPPVENAAPQVEERLSIEEPEPPIRSAANAAPTARFGAEAAGAFASHRKMSIKRRVVLVIAAVLVIAVGVATAWFVWNRWYRFDDHADIQGTWYVVGTTVPVSIDGDSIRLTDDVTYHYEMNSQDKTIRYVFGPMEGRGRYWLSDDREYLVITDGDEYTSTGTAIEDLLRAFSELPERASGNEPTLPEGDGIIAFSRQPDADAAAKEQAEADAKKKAEEDARKEAERAAAEEAAREAAEAEEYYYYEEEAPVAEEPAPEEDPQAEGEVAEGEGEQE